MRNKITQLLICLIVVSTISFSQINEISILLYPTYGSEKLNLTDSTFSSNDSSHVNIEVLKFYISKIKLLKNSKIVFEESNSFHLVDAAKSSSLIIPLKNKQIIDFDELVFSLGIDSITNVSGAIGGNLDPTNGMYWTWQSGYINFKLEGKSDLCSKPKNEFQFHLGGYSQPNYAIQNLVFRLKHSKTINLKLDIQKILMQIDLANTNHIMSPSAETVMLSRNVANAFSVIEN